MTSPSRNQGEETFSATYDWAEDLTAPRTQSVRERARYRADQFLAEALEQRPELGEQVSSALAAGHMTHTVPVDGAHVYIEYTSTDTQVSSAILVREEPLERLAVPISKLLGPIATGPIVSWMPNRAGDRLAIVVRPPGSRTDTVHIVGWDGSVRDAVDGLYRSPVRFCPCGLHVLCVRAVEDGHPRLWRLGLTDPREDNVLWDGLGPEYTYGLTVIGPRRAAYLACRQADAPRNSIFRLALDEECQVASVKPLPDPPALAAVQLDSDGGPVLRCPGSADLAMLKLDPATGGWAPLPAPAGEGPVSGFAPCGERMVALRSGPAGTTVSVLAPEGVQEWRYYDGLTVDIYAPDPFVDRLSVLVEGWTLPPVSSVVSSANVLPFLDACSPTSASIACTLSEETSADGQRVRYLDIAPLPCEERRATIVWVYGGFGVLPRPAYSAAVHAWTGLGGRFVIPLVRGGGGGSPAWQAAGTGEGKIAACEDIVAVAQGLVSAGTADPRRIVVQGGSHGGLLSSLCALQRPDLFAGYIANKAPLDLVALDRLALGRRWRHEFGDDPDLLRRLSPLEALGAADRCPNGLLVYSLDDPVVSAINSAKFLALADERGDCALAAIEHCDGGHVGRHARHARYEEIVRILAFAWSARRNG